MKRFAAGLQIVAAMSLMIGLSPTPAAAQTIIIENCSLDRAAPLLQANFTASDVAKRAAAYIETNGANALVRKWFGNVDRNQVAYVRETYLRMALIMDRGTVKHACVTNRKCVSEGEESIHAYVDLTARDTVSHYCRPFHTLGDRQKALTVIHELSHVYNIRGTADHCYREACSDLAKRRPDLSIRAADPYLLFAADVMGWSADLSSPPRPAAARLN